MVKRITKLYDACSARGPGRRGGHLLTQNLSSYTQNAEIIGHFKGKEILDNADLDFDIERIVDWKGPVLTYSSMIDAYYDKKNGPDHKEFINKILDFDGFEKTRSDSDYICFINREKNVFTNWSIRRSDHWWTSDRLCIGVIQENPTATLIQTIEMLPYFINLHNTLNPQRILSQEIVEQSIALAIKNDKYLAGKLRKI